MKQGRAIAVAARRLLSVAHVWAAHVWAVQAGPAWADAPPLATVRVASPRGVCQALAMLNPARIIVQARAEPNRILWSLPFWNPSLVLSDDCHVLGAGYDGGPLLVLSEKVPDTVVMTFYRDGRLTREIPSANSTRIFPFCREPRRTGCGGGARSGPAMHGPFIPWTDGPCPSCPDRGAVRA